VSASGPEPTRDNRDGERGTNRLVRARISIGSCLRSWSDDGQTGSNRIASRLPTIRPESPRFVLCISFGASTSAMQLMNLALAVTNTFRLDKARCISFLLLRIAGHTKPHALSGSPPCIEVLDCRLCGLNNPLPCRCLFHRARLVASRRQLEWRRRAPTPADALPPPDIPCSWA